MMDNSVTKCTPHKYTIAGKTILRYEINDLDNESFECPRCHAKMKYHGTRVRELKDANGEPACYLESPRYLCKCGKSCTMHPYFVAKHKKFSLIAIQEIVNDDAALCHIKAHASNAGYCRRWAVQFVWNILHSPKLPGNMYSHNIGEEMPGQCCQQREFILSFRNQHGDDWLVDLVRKFYDADEITLHFLRTSS